MSWISDYIIESVSFRMWVIVGQVYIIYSVNGHVDNCVKVISGVIVLEGQKINHQKVCKAVYNQSYVKFGVILTFFFVLYYLFPTFSIEIHIMHFFNLFHYVRLICTFIYIAIRCSIVFRCIF